MLIKLSVLCFLIAIIALVCEIDGHFTDGLPAIGGPCILIATGMAIFALLIEGCGLLVAQAVLAFGGLVLSSGVVWLLAGYRL